MVLAQGLRGQRHRESSRPRAGSEQLTGADVPLTRDLSWRESKLSGRPRGQRFLTACASSILAGGMTKLLQVARSETACSDSGGRALLQSGCDSRASSRASPRSRTPELGRQGEPRDCLSLREGIDGCRSSSSREADYPRRVHLSLFYFANNTRRDRRARTYRLLIEGARIADASSLTAIWTPERHFHAFGAAYPNPAVTSAFLAGITERIGIRAGSVVAPLHNAVRIVEDWAVVDNLSGGRVGVSFASGWSPRDFVLAPDAYADRKALTSRTIETVRALWRGSQADLPDGVGGSAAVCVFPRPVQRELPVWLTSAGHPDTFREAGRLQANVLTHLLGQDLDTLAQKIAVYREALSASAGPGAQGHVTLMLHTFLGGELDEIRETVRAPFSAYIRSALELELAAGATPELRDRRPAEEDLAFLVEQSFDRYFATSGLFGTTSSCRKLVRRLADVGVDEIACLIDFGVDDDVVLASLEHVTELADDLQRPAALATELPAG